MVADHQSRQHQAGVVRRTGYVRYEFDDVANFEMTPHRRNRTEAGVSSRAPSS